MELTIHQQEIADKAIALLKSGDNTILLKGSAGVGKTFVANYLINNIDIPSWKKAYCSAPTHKAVKVLEDKVDTTKSVEFITTHSALKLKRKINYKTGEISFVPAFSQRNPPLKMCGLLIIDEASMIGKQMLEYIEEFTARFNVKTIFIGDDKQINPVGETNSPVFEEGYPELELTEIVRQKEGNSIIDLSRNISNINLGYDNCSNGLGYIYSDDLHRVISTLAHVNGTDDLKYLAWTNKEVDNINTKVRVHIYGNNLSKLEVGESVIINSSYKDFTTNEELKINSVSVEDKEFNYLIDSHEQKYHKSTFRIYNINVGEAIAIHEDSEKDLNNLMKDLKRKAVARDIEWKDYYEFVEKFLDFKYNHAITVHKSQGSSYKQCIVNVGNIKFNKNKIEVQRLLYTAVTRASDLLILYNT